MPYGGNDWLGLTQEEVLEPELPICDPHHHLWDQRPERIPYQRYLLPELLADVNQGHNVRSTVFIEARVMYRRSGTGRDEDGGRGRVRPGPGCHERQRDLRAHAGGSVHHRAADLKMGDRVKPVLEALQAASPNRFRGIRHTVSWDPNPELDNRDAQGTLATDNYRAGARVLAQMGFSLDTGVSFPQLPELADFARAVPDLPIILNHLGGLWRIGPNAGRDDEVLPAWKKGLAEVAACPNVYMKLGGIGMPRMGFDWCTRDKPIGSEDLAREMALVVTPCIELFGPERCMFESNFPVDKVSFSHPVLFNAFKRFSKDYSSTERAAMFHDTAVKAYRIGYD